MELGGKSDRCEQCTGLWIGLTWSRLASFSMFRSHYTMSISHSRNVFPESTIYWVELSATWQLFQFCCTDLCFTSLKHPVATVVKEWTFRAVYLFFALLIPIFITVYFRLLTINRPTEFYALLSTRQHSQSLHEFAVLSTQYTQYCSSQWPTSYSLDTLLMILLLFLRLCALTQTVKCFRSVW